MTQDQLMEEALKRIDKLSDEELSALTKEIISESSVDRAVDTNMGDIDATN